MTTTPVPAPAVAAPPAGVGNLDLARRIRDRADLDIWALNDKIEELRNQASAYRDIRHAAVALIDHENGHEGFDDALEELREALAERPQGAGYYDTFLSLLNARLAEPVA